MKRNQLNLLITIATTLFAAIIVYKIGVMEPLKNDKFFNFPISIGTWHGEDIPMSEWVYRGIETPYVLLRTYSSQGSSLPVNLSLVWFDDKNFAFHTPEACMANFVRERGVDTIEIGKLGRHQVEKMNVEMNGQKQILIYFFDVDGFITTSQSKIRLLSLYKRLCFERTSATFVRVMVPITLNQTDSMKELESFLDNVYTILPEYTYTNRIQRDKT